MAADWIKTSDAMPEFEEEVLVYFPEYGIRIGLWSYGDKYHYPGQLVWYGAGETDYDTDGDEVEAPVPLSEGTHWMPLPQEPTM